MDFGRLRFFLGEVFANLTRNAGMQITAIGTVAVTIVLLGSVLFLSDAVGRIGAQVLDQIEISVYLNDGSNQSAIDGVRRQLQSDHRITAIRFISKAQGFREMSRRMAGQIDTSLLTTNPLPDAFRIRVDSPRSVPAVAAHVAKISGVAEVNYAQDVVAKMLRISQVVERVGLGVIIILVCVAGVIISNTIRLTVFARRREITIMQLVGATGTYIRAPFIFEGMIDGILGALIAVGILAAAKVELLPKLIGALPFLPLGSIVVNQQLIMGELLLAGAVLGVLASWFSVGRYLKA